MKKLPCLNPECGSSDAMVDYGDHYFCFSCKKRMKHSGEEMTRQEPKMESFDLAKFNELPTRGIIERGICRKVCEHYGVRVGYNIDREIDEHWYPYGLTRTTGCKVRKLPKEFYTEGTLEGLFGQRLFNNGRMLVITEGEIDALTVAQVWYEKYHTFFPVVSLRSASSVKDLVKQKEWLDSFQEITLWLDDDDVGREATEEAAKIIFGEGRKLKVVTPVPGCKDASDVYRNASTKDDLGRFIQGPGMEAVLRCIWNAKDWSPAGLVWSSETWETYVREKDAVFIPFSDTLSEFNERNFGRRFGGITLITAGTGMGKSSLLKDDMLHLHNSRPVDEKIGILSLEESVFDCVSGLMSMHAGKRFGLPDTFVDEGEERAAWEATMGSNRFIMLDHQGSVSDDSVIKKMEYMVLQGARFLYLDHITIAVSGDDKVNESIDAFMSAALKLVKRWNVWMCVVSHLRKRPSSETPFEAGAIPTEDDLKGSGALKQVPMQTIALSRNKYAVDPTERDTTHYHVLKDRYTGRARTFCGKFMFDDATGRLIKPDPTRVIDNGVNS